MDIAVPSSHPERSEGSGGEQDVPLYLILRSAQDDSVLGSAWGSIGALPSLPVRVQESAQGLRPSEALLAAVWQRQWLAGGPLIDSFGREVRVVYPGRRWGGPGPDFQGAVLALSDGSLVRGDVEV